MLGVAAPAGLIRVSSETADVDRLSYTHLGLDIFLGGDLTQGGCFYLIIGDLENLLKDFVGFMV